jgi:hypothetical protein
MAPSRVLITGIDSVGTAAEVLDAVGVAAEVDIVAVENVD